MEENKKSSQAAVTASEAKKMVGSERCIKEILGHQSQASKAIEKVFKEHESINTVVINPDSWVGKELIWQSKKMIDLEFQISKQQGLIKELLRKIEMIKL